MRLLVLGGTRFVGRWIVEVACARGHDVTLLHRGITDAGLFPGLSHIIGDRTRRADLAALAGRTWDAVIDCSGYEPRDVELTAKLLHDSIGRYVFVSTAAVYAGVWGESWDEGTPAVPETADSYGGRKRACEALLERLYGSACTITRPSIVVGPGDPDDRLGYWLRRLHRGGEALVPGMPQQIVQMIDARDHASFTVSLVERGVGGCFNVDGEPMAIGAFLEACAVALPPHRVSFAYVPGSTLVELGAQREDLPAHVPFWSRDDSISARLDITRGRAAGLTLRPLTDTARDVFASTGSREEAPQYLSEARELELLQKWRARSRVDVREQ